MQEECLYTGLKKLGLFYDPASATAYGTAMEYYGGPLRETGWFRAMPEELQRRYSFCVTLNGMKFALAAESFHRSLDREACSAAVCFLLAGCILDHMLDEGTPLEQRTAREKLAWEYCAQSFLHFSPAKADHVVDRLYGELARFLQKHGQEAPDARDLLLTHLRRAAQAEALASQGAWNGGNAPDAATVANKSVLFTVVGFELALFGKHTPEEWEVFFLIGNIFRIMDDLCDAEADSQAGRANSLLMKSGTGSSLWCEDALEELAHALARLEKLVCAPFFAFIRYELQSWTLSNPNLYRKVLEEPSCPTLC